MSDGDYQGEGKEYLPFIFEDEVIKPEQYLIWHQMREEETLMQYLEEYEPTNN